MSFKNFLEVGMKNKSKVITLSIHCLLWIFYQGVFAMDPTDQSLFSAVLSGSTQQVEQAIHNGANVNSVDENSDSALALAVKHGHFDIVQLLVEKESSLDHVSKANETLLHLAAHNGYVEIAEFLLQKKPDMIHIQNDRPSHAPSSYGDSTIYQKTPLHYAAERGQTEVAKLLLQQGAMIDALDEQNFTPLHLAALKNHPKTVKFLLDRSANKEALTRGPQKTPLYLAVEEGHIEVVRLLLKQKANPNVVDWPLECTPLYFAAEQGNSEIVKLLLDNGADTKKFIKNNRHLTALNLAVIKSHSKVVELLLERGADIYHLNADNQIDPASPLSWGFFPYVHTRDTVNILIKLLLWQAYRTVNPNVNTYQRSVSQAIDNLMRQIEQVDLSSLPADQVKYFSQIKSLGQWIIHEISNCQSKKEFLAKTLNYLFGSSSVEEKNLLKKNIKNLLLKNYLLNKENSDFYDLKSTFSSSQLQELQKLENILRYTYAKELKKDLFNNISKEDLAHKLNDLEKEDLDVATLSKITTYRINHPIIRYCNDPSIETPLKDKILPADEANRRYAFIQWVQELRAGIFPDENLSTQDTAHKAVWSKWGGSYFANFQQYIKESKLLLANIYNHLNYIIEHKGDKIDSGTELDRIDILKFTKEKTTEAQNKK